MSVLYPRVQAPAIPNSLRVKSMLDYHVPPDSEFLTLQPACEPNFVRDDTHQDSAASRSAASLSWCQEEERLIVMV